MPKDIFSIGNNDENNFINKEDDTQYIEDSLLENKPVEESYLSSNFEAAKLKWLFILIILVILCIIFRIGYLQIVKGSEYRLAAEENRIRIQEIKAPRGIIYDRNNTVLVHNVPNFILSFTSADLPDDEKEKKEIIDKIAKILELDSIELLNTINQQSIYSYQSFTLIDHISYEKAILLKIATADLPGISLNVVSFREYLSNEYFSHVIGYMGKVSPIDLENNLDYSYDDFIGKMGIEQFYDEKLRGKHGKKEIEVDSLGKESQIVNTSLPELGQSIVLTIDEGLQNVLGKAINDVVNNKQSITGAAAVALNPVNGEVLAIISNPTFDNNAITLGLNPEEYQEIINNPNNPLFNRAISGEYPSGSTIKPLIALAALEEGIINENSTFLSTGGIQIDKWFFPDWKAGGHGITDVRKAIAESVNTFFYMIGGGDETLEGLGVNRITSYLQLFGLGNLLGIDLAGEKNGFLPSKEWKEETKDERWYVGDTYHLSIGQGDILVTPLQVAAYTATIANGGTLYQPHLIKYFTTADKKVTDESEPIIIRDNFITQYYYQVVKDGLHQSVLSGSSRGLSDLTFSSAGKTGTAQFGSQGKTHAWFTSFAPYENPEIVITVIIEGGGEGHAVALPIAKQGLKYWFSEF
jgi:penicillin-binding protein 2